MEKTKEKKSKIIRNKKKKMLTVYEGDRRCGGDGSTV